MRMSCFQLLVPFFSFPAGNRQNVLIFVKAGVGDSVSASPPTLTVDEDKRRLNLLCKKWNVVQRALSYKLEVGADTNRVFPVASQPDVAGFGNWNTVVDVRQRVADTVRARMLEVRLAELKDIDLIQPLIQAFEG